MMCKLHLSHRMLVFLMIVTQEGCILLTWYVCHDRYVVIKQWSVWSRA